MPRGQAVVPVERRAFPRHSLRSAVRIRAIRASGEVVDLSPAKIENVGLGGVFIRSRQPLGRGAFTDFSFCFPSERRPVKIQGLVRWQKEGEGLGVEFFYASREQRRLVEGLLRRLKRTQRAAARGA